MPFTTIPELVALSLFCADYHGGQWSRLYRVGCLADRYLLQWFQVWSADEWGKAGSDLVSAADKQRMLDTYTLLTYRYEDDSR